MNFTKPLQRSTGGVSREKTLGAVTALFGAAMYALAAFGVIAEETANSIVLQATPIIGGVWMWVFRTRNEQ